MLQLDRPRTHLPHAARMRAGTIARATAGRLRYATWLVLHVAPAPAAAARAPEAWTRAAGLAASRERAASWKIGDRSFCVAATAQEHVDLRIQTFETAENLHLGKVMWNIQEGTTHLFCIKYYAQLHRRGCGAEASQQSDGSPSLPVHYTLAVFDVPILPWGVPESTTPCCSHDAAAAETARGEATAA